MEKIELDITKYTQKKRTNDIKEIVNYYYELRGWHKYPKEFWQDHKNDAKYNYVRNMRDAKMLYSFLDKNLSVVVSRLYDESKRSKEFSDYDWRISTITKRLKQKKC